MQPSSSSKLPQRKIGNDNVVALGFGAMGMNAFYITPTEAEKQEKEHLELLTKAADAGETFWDTSDVYGPYTNEELIGKWFKVTGRRKEIFLATKFAIAFDSKTGAMSIRGDKEYVRQSCEGSLKRLQTDYIDLYYQHRVDKNVRIEETVEAMAQLVKEGKVRYLGLSECSSRTLQRAHKVHPISAVQIEYSLFCLDIEREEVGLKKACDELGVAIVAYSPLGRGLLTGKLRSRKDLEEGDWRLTQPRFSEENFHNNLNLVDKVVEMAKQKGCTPSQLALAWLLKQGNNVIPIPGTTKWKNLEDNLGALNVNLADQEVNILREVAEKAEIKGQRYDEGSMSVCFADTI